jgi:tetratricopeptide (TPR) repeat protein
LVKAAQQDFQGMIDDCKKILEIDPNFAIAYNNRALAKIHLNKDYVGAKEDFEKAKALFDQQKATKSADYQFANEHIKLLEKMIAKK